MVVVRIVLNIWIQIPSQNCILKGILIIFTCFIDLVRYFQCEPNRGLFTRLHRLSRYPLDINGNRLPADDGLIKTRRVRTPDGKITTTVTRITKSPVSVPHYALPSRPSKVITTVTTTTTTTVDKPKSVLKSSCRITSNKNNPHANTHRVHFWFFSFHFMSRLPPLPLHTIILFSAMLLVIPSLIII